MGTDRCPRLGCARAGRRRLPELRSALGAGGRTVPRAALPGLVVATGTWLRALDDLSGVPPPVLAQRFLAALGTLRGSTSLMSGPLAAHAAHTAAVVLDAAARSKSTISASGWQGWILHLHGPVVYAVVGGLLFLEVGIVVGFFIPGEIATILGGVIASQHHANLAVMIVVVALAASLGNISGYWIGRGVGPRLLELRYLKGNAGLIRARQLLARRGGPAVFVARWVVFVRAVLPGLAGMSHMRFRKFVLFSFLGGTIWGSMWVSIGYAAGASYSTIEKAAGSWSLVILGVIVVAVAVFIVFRKRKEKRENKALLAQAAGLSPAPSTSASKGEN